ncbi:tail fiber assembly protein [Yersinia mollaretii]|uniref:tail fiber assembly protein n=1 Tax=Yersinia mollaretii TaxID=33060 RepID=UPI0011A9ECED|nr:tail fiber assembly protein [Yersinia mollaretii]
MEQAYFSTKLGGFIPAEWKSDGTYSDETWPSDAVLLTDEEKVTYWKQRSPAGKIIGSLKSRPVWVDLNADQLSDIQAADVAQARAYRSKLISDASNKIETLKDRIEAGQDKAAELKLWRSYRIALDDVDVSTAPDIKWPVAPE